MAEAVIVAARTPIGRARKGSLVDARPDDLAAFAIRSGVDQVPELDSSEIVDVMLGCGYPEQRQGMNLARRAALLADLPATTGGTTVNRFCASSLQTIRMAFHAIRAGGAMHVAAGVESITQVNGYPKSAEELHPRLTGSDEAIGNVYIPMGMTAENVAERWGVEREEMDRFAQRSQSGPWRRRTRDTTTARSRPTRPRTARSSPVTTGLAASRPREARRARASAFVEGGEGDCGQLVPVERRRRRRRRHERLAGERARHQAQGTDRGVRGLGRRSRDHGRWPDPGCQARAGPCGHDDRRHRRD